MTHVPPSFVTVRTYTFGETLYQGTWSSEISVIKLLNLTVRVSGFFVVPYYLVFLESGSETVNAKNFEENFVKASKLFLSKKEITCMTQRVAPNSPKLREVLRQSSKNQPS